MTQAYGSDTSLLEGLIKLVSIGEKIENGVFILRSSQYWFYALSVSIALIIFQQKVSILPKVIICFFIGVMKSLAQ